MDILDHETFGMEPWQVAMFRQMEASRKYLGRVTRPQRPEPQETEGTDD